MMDVDRIQQFGQLKLREDELKAELADVKAKREALEPAIQRDLSESGLDRVATKAGITVYLERKLWAGAHKVEVDGEEKPDWQTAIPLMRKAGLGDLVGETVNTQSLSAYFRELEREEVDRRRAAGEANPIVDPADLLPRELADVLVVTEKYTAKAVKS